MENIEVTDFLDLAKESYSIDPSLFKNYKVKRGLRNADGTGVLAGLTSVGEVRGYIIDDCDKVPVAGKLMYRGVNVKKIIKNSVEENRPSYEEAAFLLLFGRLPSKEEYSKFSSLLGKMRTLPVGFNEDIIMKTPCPDIMNKLARSVLSLYSYDQSPEELTLENLLRQSIELISRMSTIVAYSYHARRHYFEGESLHIHPPKSENSTAENFLHLIRPNGKFSAEEAELLDIMLTLHAEHGGGNNSAFACRVVSSTGTDTYSAIGSAICSLKGPRHGGANKAVLDMMDEIKTNVKDWTSEGELADYLRKIVRKQAGNGSGLIYGMGHAVYTLSDPRAAVLKQKAQEMAAKKGLMDEFNLYALLEEVSPEILCEKMGVKKAICANIDLYSGFVYQMLDIPPELYTPLFAVSRIVGWCSHRIEEVLTNGKIIRPAFKSVCERKEYVLMDDR
ncbi:MAG: citrate synthase [Clostridia bacterium]|nr:citrate synthase [Clostridia bacterium]